MRTTRPELRGSFGMVASTHRLASAAGMAVLEAGGNAFDAAVAVGFTLQVVEPHQNGPGGDMPALVWPAAREEPLVLCGQGPAPAAATIERYRSELGDGLVPGNGLLAAVVPGAFDGWMLLLRDFGTLRLRDVLRFAIGYAEEGFPASPSLVTAIREVEPLFRADWPGSAELWLPVPEPRARVRNRALAATYRRLLREAEALTGREEQIEAARRVFYEGFVGEALVRRAQETEALDGSGERHRGLLAGADLAGWEATWEQPLAVDYAGLTVLKPGPWSQGPVFLQQLRLLEGFDLAALRPVEYVHTLVECAKLAFADREAWYGDPAFVDVPLETLLSRAYADERRRLVGDEASGELRPGSPDGREPRLPRPVPAFSARAGLGDPTRRPSDTCHLDVADRFGNLISATPSGGWLTGSPTVPELGFCLGTRAQMFWLEDGLASSLAPGKRPRTTLSPTLVLRGGDPYLALGTPGGDQQDQWSLNVFLGHVHLGLDLQAAIDASQFHTEAFPSSFYPRATRPRHVAVEERLGVAAELRDRGHDVEELGPWSLGRVSAAGREPDGTLKAAADPRADGYAAGR